MAESKLTKARRTPVSDYFYNLIDPAMTRAGNGFKPKVSLWRRLLGRGAYCP